MIVDDGWWLFMIVDDCWWLLMRIVDCWLLIVICGLRIADCYLPLGRPRHINREGAQSVTTPWRGAQLVQNGKESHDFPKGKCLKVDWHTKLATTELGSDFRSCFLSCFTLASLKLCPNNQKKYFWNYVYMYVSPVSWLGLWYLMLLSLGSPTLMTEPNNGTAKTAVQMMMLQCSFCR